MRVAKDYERYIHTYAWMRSEMAAFVADLYSLNPDQVRDWYRNREEIYKQAKSRAEGKRCSRRKPRGRFHKAEIKTFNLFTEERKKNRRVGPRWLRRTMLKELSDTQPAPVGAELFNARRGWLRRFTKRFHIVLRRKTNNKKTPIQERVPLLQRWFSVYRTYLRSFSDHSGYDKR